MELLPDSDPPMEKEKKHMRYPSYAERAFSTTTATVTSLRKEAVCQPNTTDNPSKNEELLRTPVNGCWRSPGIDDNSKWLLESSQYW